MLELTELLPLLKDAGLVGALIYMIYRGERGDVVPAVVIDRIVREAVRTVLEELREEGFFNLR